MRNISPFQFVGVSFFYMKKIGIYKITNPKGKIYIGQSVDIYARWNKYKKLNCKEQTILYRSFLKYGVENHMFEIICECSEVDLNKKERYYQDYFNCVSKNGLNCMLTGTEDKHCVVSIETRKKQSIAKKNISEATRLKLSITSKGRLHTDETKKRISSIKTKNVINTETGIIYSGVKNAAIYNNISYSTLQKKLTGRIKNNTKLIYI